MNECLLLVLLQYSHPDIKYFASLSSVFFSFRSLKCIFFPHDGDGEGHGVHSRWKFFGHFNGPTKIGLLVRNIEDMYKDHTAAH